VARALLIPGIEHTSSRLKGPLTVSNQTGTDGRAVVSPLNAMAGRR